MTKSIQKWKSTVCKCKKVFQWQKVYKNEKLRYNNVKKYTIDKKSMRKWKNTVYKCKKVYEF